MTARRRWLRWLGRALGVAVALPVALALAAALVLGTSWGRALLLAELTGRVNRTIPGRLEVGALERLGPTGLVLAGVSLRDPASTAVLTLERLRVELAPLELLHGRIVVRRVALDGGHVDLRQLDVPRRGLLGAVLDPDAAPAAAEPGPPPYVRVERIEVSRLSVRAPELEPPWRDLRVNGIEATARLELDGAPDVVLSSLSCELSRGEVRFGRLERLEAHLARPGQASELALRLELGAASLSASARGVLSTAAEFASAPLAAELHLGGLTAPALAELLDDPALGAAFAGPIALDLVVSGHVEQVALRAALGTEAGSIDLNGSLHERRLVALGATATELGLSRLRSDLPAAPLSVSLESTADLADPARVPLTLRSRPGQLGRFALPELHARGTWTGQALRDLSLELTQGRSRVAVRGGVERTGSFDLHVGADVAAPELRALAAAAGVASPPHAALGADLHAVRSAGGALSLRGDVRAMGVRLADAALDSGRVELALDGTPPELEGRADVRITGLALGTLRVPRGALALDARGARYRLRANADVGDSRVNVDLTARREPEHWALSGNAGGRWNALPVALRLGPTAVSPEGWITTRGVDVEAGGQALRVAGGFGRPGSELRVTASALDVNALARLAGLGAEWRGRAALELRLRGSPDLPALDATLDVRELSRQGAAPISAELAARLDSSDGRASLDAALRDSGTPGWLDASVSLASEFRAGIGWQRRLGEAHHRAGVELRRLELGALEGWLGRPLPVSAVLGLSASLEGPLGQPVLHATARAAVAEALGLPALQIEQTLDYQAGELTAAVAVDDAGGRWLSLGTELTLAPGDAEDLRALPARVRTLGDTSRWSLRLDAARRRLGALHAGAPDAVAGLEFDGQVQLDHEPGAEPTGRASWHVREAAARGSSEGCAQAGVELALDAELARRKLSASLAARHRDTELMAATTTASVELAAALRGGPASLGAISSELTSRGLDLEQVPYLCRRVRGRLDARARLVDPLGAEPSLLADVKATGLSLGAEPFLDLELRARADRQGADATVDIAGPRGRSTLSAVLPVSWSSGRFAVAADAPLRARAKLLALPIAPLLDPAGAVSYATGWVSGDVAVGGTLAAPEPSGTLELSDAEFTATALAQPLHGVRGRVAFNRQEIAIERFEARDRDGSVELSGRVERRGADAFDVSLDVSAQQFPLRQRGQIVATTSGHARIHARVEPRRTSVAVKLVDADTWLEKVQTRSGIDLGAHPDFVIAGAAPAAAGDGAGTVPAAADPEPPRESLVRLDASDHFWIKRDDFAIQLSTQLDAQISGDQVKVTGRVDIHRGYLDMMGRVFDVSRGSRLEFIGGSTPDPVVDISAAYDHESSGKTVKVQISGRGSKPVLTFFIDDEEVSAGKALEVLVGRHGSGGEDSAKQEATSFVSALTAGLLATSARRELGAAAPIIMIEPGEQTGDGRIRAGFELDALIPSALRQLITGVYVEGIVEREGSGSSRGRGQEASTQAGVLLELYFPHQLFSTGQWGPGTTWSLDWGWQL